MAAMETGNNLLCKLCTAFGIDPTTQPIRRLVIDAPTDGAVVVYVQRYINTDEGDAIIDVLAEATKADIPKVIDVQAVEVDKEGNVRHK